MYNNIRSQVKVESGNDESAMDNLYEGVGEGGGCLAGQQEQYQALEAGFGW